METGTWRIAAYFLALMSSASATDIVVLPGQSVQSAIDAASNGDRVLVHAGTYFEAIDLRGKDLEVLGVDGPESTVIDATGLGTSTVTMNQGEPETSRFAGFTVVGGVGKPIPPYDQGWVGGGGIHVDKTSAPRIENCIVRNNTANVGGGIMYGGGGLATIADRERIFDCRIVDNHAIGVSSAGGGCASIAGMVRCWIEGNSSVQIGGGVIAAQMRECVVRGNTAGNYGGGAAGGGDINTKATTFVDCLFEGNTATIGGGVARSVKYFPRPLILDGCVIVGNAGQSAGGLWSANESIGGSFSAWDEYRRCIIAGNTSTDTLPDIRLEVMGPSSEGPSTVSRCTIIGDAIELREPVAFDNTIFAGIPAPVALGVDHATYVHCLAPIALPGVGNIVGTPTFVDTASHDYHLTANSFGVDSGSSTLADFESDPIWSAPDIGADEFHPHLYALGPATPNSLLQLVVISPPGVPSLLFAATTLVVPPVPTPFGSFSLGAPFAPGSPILVPPNHGSGFVRFDLRLPSSVFPEDTFFAQALVQLPTPLWTNVLAVTIQD